MSFQQRVKCDLEDSNDKSKCTYLETNPSEVLSTSEQIVWLSDRESIARNMELDYSSIEDDIEDTSVETVEISDEFTDWDQPLSDSFSTGTMNVWAPQPRKHNPTHAWSEIPIVMNTDFLTMFSTPTVHIKAPSDCKTVIFPTATENRELTDEFSAGSEDVPVSTDQLAIVQGETTDDHALTAGCDTLNSEPYGYDESEVTNRETEEAVLTGGDGYCIKLYGKHNKEKLLDRTNSSCDSCQSYQLRERETMCFGDEHTCASSNLFFNHMPLEITQKILSLISQTELGRTVALVCKAWRDFAYDPIHWQNIRLYFCQHLSTEMFERIVKRTSLLKSLCLHGRTELNSDEICLIGKHCPLLQRLDIGFIPDLSLDVLTAVARTCSSLTALNIEGCVRVDDECVALLAPNMPQLCDINLSHCTGLSDESINILTKHLMRVQKLNMDGITWITDDGIHLLVQYQGENLTHLDLDGVELSDNAIKSISMCTQLQRLSVSFGEILSGASLDALQGMGSLRELRLKKCGDIPPSSIKELFASANMSQLTMLDFSECTLVDDECVIYMMKCCGVNLKYLALGWCWNITDIGLINIVDTCRSLEYLDLLGIDKITGSCFERLPTNMPKMTHLDLRNCNQIDDDLIMLVVRKKPDLKVINYYGEEFVCISEGCGN